MVKNKGRVTCKENKKFGIRLGKIKYNKKSGSRPEPVVSQGGAG
jgi:hypothetical protein